MSLRWTLAILTLAGANAASAQVGVDVGAGAKLRLGVLDLSGSALRMQTVQAPMGQPGMPVAGTQTTTTIAIPPPSEFARGLTEMLTTVLVNTGRFVILERAQLQAVQQEQDLGASGRVNKEFAAAPGGLLGAQALITGDITGFTYNRSSVGGQLNNIIPGLNASSERVTAEVIIDLRVIDAVTGEVLSSHKGKGSASATGAAATLTKDDKSIATAMQNSTPLGKASREALQEAVTSMLLAMPKVRWSARVIDVRENNLVYINQGTEGGVRAGMELEIYQPQPPLVDPETGRNLGSPDRLVATGTVGEVAPKYAVLRVPDGSAIQRTFVVRIKGQKANP
jgi:curli biogenesis system outer membrane secretion channel CsgG